MAAAAQAPAPRATFTDQEMTQLATDFYRGTIGDFNPQGMTIDRTHDGKTRYYYPRTPAHIAFNAFKECHINAGQSPEQASRMIELFFAKAKKNVNSLWINYDYPLKSAPIIPPEFFRCRNGVITDHQAGQLRFWFWLNGPRSTISRGATHALSATGLLIDTAAKKVLLVRNKNQPDQWSLPEGSFDLHKDVGVRHTAIRKIGENVGWEHFVMYDVQEAQMVGELEFYKNPLAKSITQVWAFKAPGISNRELKNSEEIEDAKWFSIQDILNADKRLGGYDLYPELKRPFQAALKNLGLKSVDGNAQMSIFSPALPQEAPASSRDYRSVLAIGAVALGILWVIKR